MSEDVQVPYVSTEPLTEHEASMWLQYDPGLKTEAYRRCRSRYGVVEWNNLQNSQRIRLSLMEIEEEKRKVAMTLCLMDGSYDAVLEAQEVYRSLL